MNMSNNLFFDTVFNMPLLKEQEQEIQQEAPPQEGEVSPEEAQMQQPSPEEGQEQQTPPGEQPPPEAPEEELELEQIGYVYELKKVYARLIAVSNILDYKSDTKYDDLKKDILEAIDIFHVIIGNFSKFKESLKDILNNYQGLLSNITKKLKVL